ncbi:TPA: glucose sorbosone dehydrogenase [Candidatus Daviesbacteria bacterium]|nr:glucose sorbosone dehydrogenase [Candidatus Daviesbacteria bacterium]
MPIKKDFIYVGIILLLIFLAVFYLQKNQQKLKSQEVPVYAWEITEVAGNLEVPWDMALSPNKDIFITERPGRLKLLTKDGQVKIVATLPQVASVGESGLTGLALHPNFSQNSYLYLYYSYREGGELFNRVSRFTFRNDSLSDEQIILDKLPGGNIHNGGRLRFGPDNKLWVLTGDGGHADLAQNMQSLGGKVLRINDNGSDPEIYSLGHRNPQGLDFHPLTKESVVTEHGQAAYDEINLIKQGGNYGWPIVKKCFSDDPQYTSPILCSGEQTWAPSGAAFLGNSLFFAGLRGQLLERVEIINGQVTARETIIKDTYGRLRGVLADQKEGVLYVSTSNLDGRGNPKPGDDKILKIRPVQSATKKPLN